MYPNKTSSDSAPAHISYALMAVSVFTALPILIAVIVSWINRDNTLDPVLQAHYTWQIRTFFFNLLWLIVGSVTWWVFGLGFVILALNQLWLVYRVAVGWYRLSSEQYPGL